MDETWQKVEEKWNGMDKKKIQWVLKGALEEIDETSMQFRGIMPTLLHGNLEEKEKVIKLKERWEKLDAKIKQYFGLLEMMEVQWKK